MKVRAGFDPGGMRQRLMRVSLGAGAAIILLVVLTGCATARTGAQLVDDVARALGRSTAEVDLLVASRTTATETSDDVLRRLAAPLREPTDLREQALTVSCQTAIDLLASDEPPSEKTLLILINNIAGLDFQVASLQQVQGLSDAALEELGGKRDAVRLHNQLDRFKDAACTK